VVLSQLESKNPHCRNALTCVNPVRASGKTRAGMPARTEPARLAFRHSVADGADNGHHHRATDTAADYILDDGADIDP